MPGLTSPQVASIHYDLDLPPNATFGYGTSIHDLGSQRLLFSFTGPGLTRLALLDLRTGQLQLARSPGLLRDILPSPTNGRVHALTTSGLLELELEPLRVARTAKAGVTKYPQRLVPIPGSDEALVSTRLAKAVPRVSLSSYGQARRTRVPELDVLREEEDGYLGFCFRSGSGVQLDAQLRITDRFTIPEAIDFAERGPGYLLATTRDEDSDGRVAVWQPDSKFVRASGRIAENVLKLLGVESLGLAVVLTSDGLAWLDGDSLEVVARMPAPAGAAALVDGRLSAVLSEVSGKARATPTLTLATLRQDGAAQDPLSGLATASSCPSQARRKAAPKAAPIELVEESSGGRTRIFKNQTYRDVEIIGAFSKEAFEFERCTFDHCRAGSRTGPRHRLRRITLRRCTLDNCHLFPSIFEDCLFEDIAFRGDITVRQFRGCAFKHVTIAGPVRASLDIFDYPLHRDRADLLAAEDAAYYRDVDWALDISRAEFTEVRIHTIPGRLIRRDQETQALVRREKLVDDRWSKMNLGLLEYDLKDLIRSGKEDLVLIAPRRGKNFKAALAAIQRLREAGIAELE